MVSCSQVLSSCILYVIPHELHPWLCAMQFLNSIASMLCFKPTSTTQETKAPLRRRGVSAECQTMNATHFVAKVVAKSPGAKERIKEALHRSYLFKALDQEQVQTVVDSVEEERFAAGEVVIKQGDPGDKFYLMEFGNAEVWIARGKHSAAQMVKTYEAGDSFGELALLYNAPRAATVKATTDCVLWAMDRQTFKMILMYTTNAKRQLYEKFLDEVDLLKTLSKYEKAAIADVLDTEYFEAQEEIIVEGDPGDRFYLIEEGHARAIAKGKVVKEYGRGDYFGELALINDEPRAATVVATTRCKCVSIDSASFKRLLGQLESLPQSREDYGNVGGAKKKKHKKTNWLRHHRKK